MYNELNREKQGHRIILNPEDIIKFWNDIWSIRKEYGQQAEWWTGRTKQFETVNSIEKVKISQEMVKMQCRKMPNWNDPGKDDVQGYWLKNLTSLNPHIAVQLNHILDILDKEQPLPPDWMTFGNTALCTKRPGKWQCS